MKSFDISGGVPGIWKPACLETPDMLSKSRSNSLSVKPTFQSEFFKFQFGIVDCVLFVIN